MHEKLKFIALICCRGGSKGIPGKNIKKFAGKPLLGWILEAAIESEIFDDIILSTDSEEIAKVGKFYGATVPELRPSRLAQDKSDQFDTHKYIFDLLGYNDNEHRVCVITNNPLIDAKILKSGYNAAKESCFERIVLDTVTVPGDYIFFRQCFSHKGLLRFYFPKDMMGSEINRQSLDPAFATINNMRWGKPSYLQDYGNYKKEVIKNGIVPVKLPKLRNIDIDDMDDWRMAEAVFKTFFLEK